MKHHNLYENSEIYSQNGKPKKLPTEVATKLAEEASRAAYARGAFGGRCEKCGRAFDQNYLTYVVLGNFKSGYVCKACQKKYGLQKI